MREYFHIYIFLIVEFAEMPLRENITNIFHQESTTNPFNGV